MTPTTTDVPSGVDGVTPQWLTEVVGGHVTDVRVEQIALDSGFSSWLYRAYLAGDSVPDSVIVKLPAQSDAGQAMVMMGGYAREVAFYRDVAGRAPIGTPHVYMAAMAENMADFVLVLEDMRHWDNADHLAGLSLDRARCAIAAVGRPARVVDRPESRRWTRSVSEHKFAGDARPASGRVRARLACLPRPGRRSNSGGGRPVRGAIRRARPVGDRGPG